MRPLVSAGTLTATVAAALLLAPSAHATPPGDNGTVKIHDAKTGEELRKNEPHVCTFYLDGFGFDDGQQVDWRIEAWAPTAGTKGETVKSGSLTLDADGHGRTEELSLPDGHYKLFWNFDGEHGRAKHKVFWTDCEGEKPGGGKPSEPTTPSPGESTPGKPTPGESTPGESSPGQSSPAPSGSTQPGDTPPPSEGAGTKPSASPSSAASPQGDLAETGSSTPVGPIAAVSALFVAAGGYLMFRRRKARQH